jgi:GNAT superfamily N-acetyltransferase
MRIAAVDPDGAAGVVTVAELLGEYDRELLGAAEPPRSVPLVRAWLEPMGGRVRHAFVAFDGDRPAGVATMQLHSGGGNDHLAWVRDLFVVRSSRRSGIGTALLERLRTIAAADSRTVLALRHSTGHAGGAGFAERHGMTNALRLDQRRLDVGAWAARSVEPPRLPDGFEFVGWDDRCPDELVAAYCAAHAHMHDAPRPASTSAWVVTPGEVRAYERMLAEHGGHHWVLCVRKAGADQLAGYTEWTFEPGEPWLARQGDTGIDPLVRRQGIARALKLANLQRLVRDRPEVRTVETFNASDNAAMIALNDAFGFELALRWQDVEDRLPDAASRGSGRSGPR